MNHTSQMRGEREKCICVGPRLCFHLLIGAISPVKVSTSNTRLSRWVGTLLTVY